MRILRIKLLLVLLSITFCGLAQDDSKPDFRDMKKALIIIDIQEFYFPGGSAELKDPGTASEQAAKVLEEYRNRGELVIHVRHNYEPGGTIHANVEPGTGEKIISKDYANSFRDTDLDEYLKANNVELLVITGMQTHMCVEATTRAGADLGYQCIVLEDACTTRDLKYGEDIVEANDVHLSTLATLKGGYAKIMTVEEYIQMNQR